MALSNGKLFELLFQIIPVMIGVFLGFLVNDWREQKQSEEQAAVFIENVVEEIKSEYALQPSG